MPRRISTKKRFPRKDLKYNSLLVTLLLNRILKSGKMLLAKRILYKSFDLIEFRTNKNPIAVLEAAIRNVSPRVRLAPKIVSDSTYYVPTSITLFRSTTMAIKWIVEFSRKRSGKEMAIKLASEIIDSAKGSSQSIRKKEETHKMAEANKAFLELD